MTSLSSLMSQLEELESEGKHLELSACILNLIIKDVDASPLAGKIIKYLALPSPPLKKVMYSFLTKYSSKISDLNILATNSLLKDFQDPNPYMRRLVIKTASSIECLSDLAFQILPQALEDTSAYVRSSAATSCVLLINKTNLDANQEIIHKLYEMIRDPDPSVICCCLSALDEILQSDGGVVVNSKIVSYLISRILEFNDLNFSVLYSILKKYSPKSSEELICLLNALDERFLSNNPTVFCLAADVAMQYIKQLQKDFSGDILRQIFPNLKFLLITSNSEMLYSLLEFIERHLPEHRNIFSPCHNLFLCGSSDPAIIKVKKLKLLVYFVDSTNVSESAKEFLCYCYDIDKDVSHQGVQSYITILKDNPNINTEDFVSLLDISYNNLNEDILNSLSDLDFDKLNGAKEIALEAISKQAFKFKDLSGKLSLLKLVGRYGKEMKTSPYIIEQYVNNDLDFEKEMFSSHLIMAAVKLFLVRPEEMYMILGRVLQWAEKSPSFLLKKQAAICYFLLKDHKNAIKIFH